MTQDGAHQIGIRVCATIANEGRTTARVAFTPGPGVEIESVEHEKQSAPPQRSGSTSGAAPPKIVQQSGAYLLRPDVEFRVSAILSRSAKQWTDQWTAGNGAFPFALGHVDVAVTAGSALVNDTCRLQFGRYPLVPHPAEDGWVIAATDMTHYIPNPPPPPDAIIGRMEREYPRRE
jgi:hypothetical protein